MPSIEALVAEYRRDYLPSRRAMLTEYRKGSTRHASLSDAINHALAVHPKSMKHPHQYRLSMRSLRKAARFVLKESTRLKACSSFDDVWKVLDDARARTKGFGELGAYDAALRIGAWLGHAPTAVYLHAGTRKGARSLLGASARGPSVERSLFPSSVKLLEADAIEDFLCIYKAEIPSPRSTKKRTSAGGKPRRREGTACG